MIPIQIAKLEFYRLAANGNVNFHKLFCITMMKRVHTTTKRTCLHRMSMISADVYTEDARTRTEA